MRSVTAVSSEVSVQVRRATTSDVISSTRGEMEMSVHPRAASISPVSPVVEER
jgi:hypothetical protein